MNKRLIAIGIVVALGVGLLVFFGGHRNVPEPAPFAPTETKSPDPQYKVIGLSVEGRKIESYTYGNGEINLAFVGGIHGGYEQNSVLLAYKFIDYFEANPEMIPQNLTVTIIPSANPDGVYKVAGEEDTVPGRFNAHAVDLNRNFDCKWKPESTWRGNIVSAGSEPFSEPEAMAIRNFVLENNPNAVVFWHSQSNAVYASECEDGILPETLDIMSAYSKASGYPAVESFDSYEITGDAEGWLASINIPAITVELQTHEAVEWERNLAGVNALFEYYSFVWIKD